MARQLLQSWTKKDFRVETFCSGGPGGQHQNKNQTGIRITHIESGLSVRCTEHKSQHANKKTAFRRLANLLISYYHAEEDQERYRSTKRVRTYHEPRKTVTDHRTGLTYDYVSVVRKNNIDQVIEDCVKHGLGEDLE